MRMSREYERAVDVEQLKSPAEVIRMRWRELAELADDARELSYFCSMLLEELCIARGLLLHTDSDHLPPSCAADELGTAASRSEAKRQLESCWLDQFRRADGLPQLRLAFERLLDAYMQARSRSDSR